MSVTSGKTFESTIELPLVESGGCIIGNPKDYRFVTSQNIKTGFKAKGPMSKDRKTQDKRKGLIQKIGYTMSG